MRLRVQSPLYSLYAEGGDRIRKCMGYRKWYAGGVHHTHNHPHPHPHSQGVRTQPIARIPTHPFLTRSTAQIPERHVRAGHARVAYGAYAHAPVLDFNAGQAAALIGMCVCVARSECVCVHGCVYVYMRVRVRE